MKQYVASAGANGGYIWDVADHVVRNQTLLSAPQDFDESAAETVLYASTLVDSRATAPWLGRSGMNGTLFSQDHRCITFVNRTQTTNSQAPTHQQST